MRKDLFLVLLSLGTFIVVPVYGGVPVILGAGGVEEIVGFDLSQEEKEALKQSFMRNQEQREEAFSFLDNKNHRRELWMIGKYSYRPFFDFCTTGSIHPGFASRLSKQLKINFLKANKKFFSDGKITFNFDRKQGSKKYLVVQPTWQQLWPDRIFLWDIC